MAEIFKIEGTSGEQATESDGICIGQGTLSAREIAVARWLRDEVAPAYDAHKADSTRAVALDEGLAQVRRGIAKGEGRR